MAGIALLVEIVLAVGVVAYIGYPLLKERLVDDEPEEMPEVLEELYSRKESTYSALKELEFDYKTGKLSETDYHELDVRFRAEAVEILEAIEEEEKPAPKRVVPAARAAEAVALPTPAVAVSGGSAAGVAPVKGSRPRGKGGGGRVTCAACDWENPAGARFCASCGGALAPVAAPTNGGGTSGAACIECGGALKPGQRFCGGCGAEVRA